MNEWHVLSAHPADSDPLQVQLRARLRRNAKSLSLEYEVTGPDTPRVVAPPRVVRPGRVHDLWKSTCFEAFIRVLGKPGYWEINLSPSGRWNIYRLEGYRSPLAETRFPREVGTLFSQASDRMTLKSTIDIEHLTEWAGHTWEVALCAILETREATKTHWALTHSKRLPDFHDADGFALTVPMEDA